MRDVMNLLNVVALTEDIPQKNLLRGQMGTVVESFSLGVYEVEFSGDDGRTLAPAAAREA